MPYPMMRSIMGNWQDWMVAWYDASAITGLTNGAAVPQWNDLSGRGLHAVQATGANQPTFVTAAYNGLACVRFDGTNDVLNSPSFASVVNPTIFVVGKGVSGGTYVSGGGGAFVQTNRIFAGTQLASPGISTTLTLTTAVFRGASSIVRQGASSATGAAGSTGWTVATLGMRVANAAYLLGDICEIQIWPALLDPQIATIEAALKTKWGTP